MSWFRHWRLAFHDHLASCVQVSDNVGVDAGQVTSSPVRGGMFSVGTTPVIYTATDRAGLKSSCTFNVEVVQQSGQ